jgi:hypothetical protein
MTAANVKMGGTKIRSYFESKLQWTANISRVTIKANKVFNSKIIPKTRIASVHNKQFLLDSEITIQKSDTYVHSMPRLQYRIQASVSYS